MDQQPPAKTTAPHDVKCGSCRHLVRKNWAAGEMEPDAWWAWACVQKWWRESWKLPGSQRDAMVRAAEKDKAQRPAASLSVKTVGGGLPGLGKRR